MAAVDLIPYAELHCISNFSFLRGASSPEELVERAAELGYSALALTDECSVAGVVRAHVAAREHGLHLLIGSEFVLEDGLKLVLLAIDRNGYRNLCGLITLARRAAPKGEYRIERDAFAGLRGCFVLCSPAQDFTAADAAWLKDTFADSVWLLAELPGEGDDALRAERCRKFSHVAGLPIAAAGDVHMHSHSRRALQDTVTAIRLGLTLEQAGPYLHANGERYLRDRRSLMRRYPEAWLREAAEIACHARFSLDQLGYKYPHELVPFDQTPSAWLRHLTEQGMRWRWPEGVNQRVRELIEYELALIAELGYEAYFLTVYDIVRFARKQDILCQGRGSAANSAVCFCLGITEVDPVHMNMLVERFISKERNEPPDIDVDFEHERREEVIQYIYGKYGRERAALTATVITYRPRSAIRDVGKALGLAELQINRMARSMQWWDGRQVGEERVREAGLDPDSPLIKRLLFLVDQLLGAPRHLSQHVGGFLIAEQPLSELVPVENAAMDDRTIIQWDKNDLDDLGLLKVDVLGLGMLSVIHRSFDLFNDWYGRQLSLATVPAEDPRVYDMISAGDTVGVFQIESRAQMAMLPRLQPRCYYDLVIEVALIRPGPIQGDMVHPYLRRRNGEEPVVYPSEAVREVLERTLGVPIFQEQVMQLAIVAAGFSGGQADRLRRSMAAWKRRGGLEPFRDQLADGMRERGYSPGFTEQIFRQIQGFGEYGFPESHAASFALLVYVSAWLKCHEPAIFACALLNSQPMGFYSPSQIVQMAQKQAVEVRAVDLNYSQVESSLERAVDGQPALRLGLSMIKGLSAEAAEAIVSARGCHPFVDVADLNARASLTQRDYGALSAADALHAIAGHRHRAWWAVSGIEAALPLFPVTRIAEGEPLLKKPDEMTSVIEDYASVGLSLRKHPLALLREQLGDAVLRASELWQVPDGSSVYTAGLVITRQRPGSSANVTFVTLEDETGFINLVVWEQLADLQRRVLLGSTILGVRGRTQKQDGVLHVIAGQLEDRSSLLVELQTDSRDFH